MGAVAKTHPELSTESVKNPKGENREKAEKGQRARAAQTGGR